jgi:hypothetical protein
MINSKILRSNNGYILRIEYKNKDRLKKYCKDHKIKYIDKSIYNY